MILKRNTFVFALILLSVMALMPPCDAKGGRGGGGRGSSSSIGGRGWFGGSKSKSSGNSWSSTKSNSGGGGWSSSKGTSSVVNGRNVVGTYKSFGSPSRWSLYHGRSYYFVGYPYGHRHYGTSRGGIRGGEQDDGGLLSPWVIMILILIGINVVGLCIWTFVYCTLK